MFTVRRCLSLSLCILVIAFSAAPCFSADWIVKRSRFTHDPNTHARVTQYSPIGPFYANDMPNYQKSGYRYSRSSIQVGPSADHLHTVEEWGRPIEPYGEWRYPYRPYSVPYQAWGPPYGGLNNVGLFPGFGYGYGVPFGAAAAGMGGGGAPGGPGMSPGGPGFGGGHVPGFGPGFGSGYGSGYVPRNNWTNPFGGPPGTDEYYPDAPSPSRLQPYGWGPRGF
jgi:hypothetical protein